MTKKKIKVITKQSKADTTDKSLNVESFSTYEMITEWDKSRVADSLQKEAGVTEKLAKDIANAVENKLLKLEIESISTEFIRSLVDEELLIRGEKKKLQKQKALIIPTYDLEQVLFDKTNENSNVQSNSPEAVNMFIAESILKQYALNRVFSTEVANSHLNGEIHLHDLGYIDRVYSLDGLNSTIEIKSGINGPSRKICMKNLYDVICEEELYDPELDAHIKYPKDLFIRDKNEWVELKKVLKHKTDKKILKIDTTEGDSLWVTEDHPCIILENEIEITKQAKDLKENDILLKIILINASERLKVFMQQVKIKKIQKVINSSDFVYDVTTKSGTFICNNLLIHNCSSHSLEYIKKYGLSLQNLSTKSSPAKYALTLTGHLNTFLASMQAFYAGALGISYVNIFYAPFLLGMTKKELKQQAQYLIFSCSQNAFSRGGQTLFIDFNIHLGVPSILADVPTIGQNGKYITELIIDGMEPSEQRRENKEFRESLWILTKERDELTHEKILQYYELFPLEYEGKKIIEYIRLRAYHTRQLTYKDFEKKSQEFAQALMEVWHEGDSNHGVFPFPKFDLHVNEECFTDETQKKLMEYACELSADKGITYFFFDRSEAQLAQCISGNSLIKINNKKVQIEDLFEKLSKNVEKRQDGSEVIKIKNIKIDDFDIKNNKKENVNMNALMRKKYKGNIIKTMINNKELICTPDHKFTVKCKKNNELIEITAEKLYENKDLYLIPMEN